MSATMDAVVITAFGGPSVLQHQRVPKPVPQPGEVLVRVKAFGVNHAEMHMRRGEWDEWNPISGLEAVGLVEACPGGEVATGDKVVAVMGGMGRSRPGGYGEFVAVPASNVVAVQTDLPWEQLAVFPEVYSTAWTCLFTVLDLKSGETLLIRGATSTIGQAALHLAVHLAGAAVTATSRREDRFDWLREMGATEAVLEKKELATELGGRGADGGDGGAGRRFDKVLNLVGNSVLLESIALTRAGGRMLQAGWLGGLDPVKDFNPMVQMEPGVHFSLFHSKTLGSKDFPLSNVPLQDIVRSVESGDWDARPAHVFGYGEIQEAHRMLDSHNAGGKIVVKH